MIGSFATGYDQITRRTWVCAVHGVVPDDQVVLAHSIKGWFNWHLGCGETIKRVTLKNFPGGTTL